MGTSKTTAVRCFALWLLAMVAGALVVWNTRFVADVSFFLPSKPTEAQQVLIDQLREGAVSRLLLLSVAGGTPEQRAQVSRELRRRLLATEQSNAGSVDSFVTVQNGESEPQNAERDLLFRHRYLLSPTVTPERFTVEGLRAAISDSIDLLASPAGMILKPFLTRDPTGELFEIVSRLQTGNQPNSRAGVWASRDGERAMLIAQTRALGSDIDGQQAAMASIESSFAEVLRTVVGQPALQLELSGPGRFAVESRARIQEEVTRISVIATVAIIFFLAFVYRSPRMLALGLLPVATGALAGIVAVSLAHGSVFGVTVGFGTALIGEAVDYSIYYFVQSGQLGIAAWHQRFWPTIRLGVLTSVAGFAALLFSGFPGLSQLGLYALTGILVAALATRFLLPQLAGGTLRCRDLSASGRKLGACIGTLRRWRAPVLVLAMAAIAYLAADYEHLWQSNISSLSTVSVAEVKRDTALRADVSAPDSRYFVVATGADRESALQSAERVGKVLDKLVVDKVIGSYDSPVRFMPSAKTQAEHRAALPDGAALKTRLQDALKGQPLRAERLDLFINEIEAARKAPALTPESLAGSALGLAVDALLVQRHNGYSVLLPLHASAAQAGGSLEIPVDSVRKALAGSDALFIDMKTEFDALYGNYLSEAVKLSLAGFSAIVLLLAFALRSLRRVAAVLLPLLLAVVFVIAGLHALGETLHLLHLIGMLFIIAVGSNYALFFQQDGAPPDADTLPSLAIANVTSVIGFGSLGLSTVPVLKAIGVTVGPGAVLALVLGAMFMKRQSA